MNSRSRFAVDDLGESVSALAERIGAAFEAPLLGGTRQHRVRVTIARRCSRAAAAPRTNC